MVDNVIKFLIVMLSIDYSTDKFLLSQPHLANIQHKKKKKTVKKNKFYVY